MGLYRTELDSSYDRSLFWTMQLRILIVLLLSALSATASPSVGGMGDSIMEGYSHWQTAIAGTQGGDISYNPMYRLSVNSGGSLTYTNVGYPGWRCDQSLAELPWLSNSPPAQVIYHCGANDVAQGTAWSTVLASINSVKAYLSSIGSQMILDEIFPSYKDRKST